MTKSTSWALRRATGADAPAVAAMHVRAWQVAYRGIVSDAILDGLDVAARAARYRFDPGGPADPETWIAVEGEVVAGMVTVGPCRDADGPGLGEVWALYVAPDRWRAGLGSTLMARAEALLVQVGYPEATLWVLEANARARAFYEAAGWVADGRTKVVEIGGREVGEVRYRRALTGAGQAPKP